MTGFIFQDKEDKVRGTVLLYWVFMAALLAQSSRKPERWLGPKHTSITDTPSEVHLSRSTGHDFGISITALPFKLQDESPQCPPFRGVFVLSQGTFSSDVD